MSASANFEYALGRTLNAEGGYVDDPNDSGGATKYGISQAAFPELDIRNLTLPQAKALYYERYWAPAHLDQIPDRYVAAELFDTAVNCGVVAAVLIAQRACNFLGEALKEDGRMGRQTAGALNRLADRYRVALLTALNLFQGLHYIEVIERYPEKRTFARGWMKRLALPPEAVKGAS